MKKIILASNSSRRRELFGFLGWNYTIMVPDIDETIETGKAPEDLVEDFAYEKALKVFRDHQDEIVIGFDTLVYTADRVFGKPKDKDEAQAMLAYLSGKDHYVVTGVAILAHEVSRCFNEKTKVSFISLDDRDIEEYVKTGEPMDKAGAYAAQGFGAKFINKIEGDFYTVVGIPLSRLYTEMKQLGLLD